MSSFILDEQTAAFMQRFVSINAATRDTVNMPAVARAYGFRVSPDRSEVAVFLPTARNQVFLDALRITRVIAVVFSRPSTHQTIQLKGSDARPEPMDEEDGRAMREYRDSMIVEFMGIGHTRAFAEAMLLPMDGLDARIRFTPQSAYTQTPGPGAGARLTA